MVLGGDSNLDPVWAKRLRMTLDASSFELLAASFEATTWHANLALTVSGR